MTEVWFVAVAVVSTFGWIAWFLTKQRLLNEAENSQYRISELEWSLRWANNRIHWLEERLERTIVESASKGVSGKQIVFDGEGKFKVVDADES